MDNKKDKNQEFLLISELAHDTPYSAGYLSLLARQGKLESKKIGRNWYSTRSAIKKYLARQLADKKAREGFLKIYTGPEILSSETIAASFNENADESTEDEMPIEHAREYIKNNIVPFKLEDLGIDTKEPQIAAPESRGEPRPIEIGRDDKADKLFERFIEKFITFLDLSIESHFGIFHKLRRNVKEESREIIKSPKKSFTTLLVILAIVLLPISEVLGQIDDVVFYAYNKIRDAETLMGHRAGTGAGDVLILDKNGNVAIRGHIETEGQLRSSIEDGLAPIVVDSLTKVENLNVDYLDDLSSEDFTLAFVTKNGNVTYENVFLEGSVEVGSTLTVKGAAKLLSELEIHGKVHALDEALFSKGITVEGPANVRDILAEGFIIGKVLQAETVFAKREITAPVIEGTTKVEGKFVRAGNLTVDGQAIFQGMAMFNNGLRAERAVVEESLETGGNFGAYGKYIYIGTERNASEIAVEGSSFTYNGESVCTGSECTVNNSGWTDDGDVVRLTTATNYIGTGTTSPTLTGVGDLSIGGVNTGTTSDMYVSGGLGIGNATTTDDNLQVAGIIQIGNGSSYLKDSATSTFTGGIFANDLKTNLPGCDSLDTDASGAIICGSDATGAGGGSFAWT
ncbi:hypothetical protein ACFL3E_02000, partial [Patescibacteria group bacterium]